MAELALRIGVEAKTDDDLGNCLEVGVPAVVTNGERFLNEDNGADVVLAGNASAHVLFEDCGDDIAKGPETKGDSIKENFRTAILVERLTEEDKVGAETRALAEVTNGGGWLFLLVGELLPLP